MVKGVHGPSSWAAPDPARGSLYWGCPGLKRSKHVYGGGQQATAGRATPFTRLRPSAPMCDWIPCPLGKPAARRGLKTTDKCGWHWPTLVEKLDTPTVLGIWGGNFKTEHSQKPLSLPSLVPPVGECLWGQQMPGHSGLRPHTGRSQLAEVESMLWHALTGTSPWDTATLCSTVHRSWTASIFSPWEQHIDEQAGGYSSTPGAQATLGTRAPWIELPLHNLLKQSGSTPQTPRRESYLRWWWH